MALQLGALRDALDAANVPGDLSRKAAEVAGYHSDIATPRTEMKTGFAEINGELRLLKWMATFSIGLSLLVLGKLFGVVN